MTNGEKMQADFPGIRITLLESYVQVMGENYEFNNAYPLEWWNAEYKEPSSSEKPNLSKNLISSTTKNGISNRSIIYKAKESKDIQEDLEKLEKLNEPTTKNCESCRHYGLHHEICNYCYKCSLWIEKDHNLCDSCTNKGCEFQSGIVRTECAFFYMPPQLEPDHCGNYVVQALTTKNDLAVDCMKKSDVINIIQDMHGLARADVISDAVNRIITAPPVTPIRPIRPKGHWIEERNDYGEIEHWHCSNCYDDTGFITTCKWDYCPSCGSDNREVEE